MSDNVVNLGSFREKKTMVFTCECGSHTLVLEVLPTESEHHGTHIPRCFVCRSLVTGLHITGSKE